LTPVRRRIASAALVAAGLLVALGVAELALRAFWPQRSFVSVGMFESDPEAGYRLRPGYRSEVRVPEYRTQIRIDGRGYRVPLDAPPEPEAASRILAIGDSFTFGVGVEARDAFPEVLERELDRAWPGAWTVRNGGVGGYGPLRSASHLFGSQADWEPDVVIHALYVGNDLEDPHPDTFREDPVVHNGRMVTPGRHPLLRLRLALRTRSHLYAFVRQHAYGLYVASGLARRSQYLDPMGLAEWPARVESESWPAGRDAMVAIRDWCREHGARYVVVLVPTRWQVDDAAWTDYREAWGSDRAFDRDHAQRVVTAELAAAGVDVLDLLPLLREAVAAGERPYFRHDTHWTARGHALAAEAIRADLEARGWIGPSGDPRRSVVQARDAADAG